MAVFSGWPGRAAGRTLARRKGQASSNVIHSGTVAMTTAATPAGASW